MKIFDPQAKILANFDYTRQLLETGYSPPVLVEIDPSNVCNHACAFCLSSHIHFLENKNLSTFSRAILSEEALLSLVKDLIKIKAKAINWTGGGEPTLNPHLGSAIAYVGQHSDIKMGMFTNGTLLKKFDLFEIIIAYLTWIRFSVDSGPSSYNRIRRVKGEGDWDTMINNLQELLSQNQKTLKPIDIGLGFCITPDNYKEIVEFAEFFKDFPVSYIQFKPEVVNIERENGAQREIWDHEAVPYIEKAKEILGTKFHINDYKLSDLIEDPTHLGRSYTKCLGSQLTPCVGADERVYVCPNLRGYPEYSYGSVYEKSFIDIWKDIQIRQTVMAKIEGEKFCHCSKLCKNHESNKKVWQLYTLYQAAQNKKAWLDLMETECKKISIKHPEFI